MRIGFLFPSVLASNTWGKGRIFAPKDLAIAIVNGLVDRGHDVTVYASRDMETRGKNMPGDEHLSDDTLTYFQFRNRVEAEQQYTLAEIVKRDFEYDLTQRAYKDAQNGVFDIVHSFHDFGAHYFHALTGFPTVFSLHDPLPQRIDTIEYRRLSKCFDHQYISISNSQRKGIIQLNFIATIYHGLDLTNYPYTATVQNHLIHFGRIMEDKGADVAIEAARQAGLPLKIATSDVRGNRSQVYYDEKIAPLVDNRHVQLVGFLTGVEKANYIGSGKAFLFPLRWEEPFGMVMIEAMACGTPVIAYNRGSVPEIVADGETGFIVNEEPNGPIQLLNGKPLAIQKTGVQGLVEAIKRIGEIDRAACRKHVEEHFTVEKMVEGYERVYQEILSQQPA